ncbi:hypothetical protein [Streptomyces nigrescens]
MNACSPEGAAPDPGPTEMEAACADDQPEHERADDGDSQTLTRLRERVHQKYTRQQQQYGVLGRSL